jgi:hypothetical protein
VQSDRHQYVGAPECKRRFVVRCEQRVQLDAGGLEAEVTVKLGAKRMDLIAVVGDADRAKPKGFEAAPDSFGKFDRCDIA